MGEEQIFHVVDSLRTGGTERMAVNVSNGLARRGWDVHLFATRELGPLAEDVDQAVHLHALHRKTRWDLSGLRDFRRALIKHQPSIVHCHGWSTLQFVSTVLSSLRHPPVLVLHDHHPRSAPMAWHYRAVAWLHTSAHVAVDEQLLSPSLRTRRKSVAKAIPNGVPLDRYKRKGDYELSEPPRLVALANLRPPKGHHVLAHALSELGIAGIELNTDLVGASADEGYLAELRALATELGLEDHIQELGLRADVAALLPTYDIGVVPSEKESGPLVLIEYMASGLPFVTTDTGAIPQALPEDLRSWVVPTADAAALASRIRELLCLSAQDRRTLGERCFRYAEDHLSIEVAIDLIQGVYETLAPTGERRR